MRLFILPLLFLFVFSSYGEASLERPLSEFYWNGTGSIEVREKTLTLIKVMWGDLEHVMREPPPSQVDWYKREAEYYYKFLAGNLSLKERAMGFVRSIEFTEINLYFILRRISNSIAMIEKSQSEKKHRREMMAWLGLFTELGNCADVSIYVDRLSKAGKFSSESGEDLKLFCSVYSPSLGRNVILPFFHNEYLEIEK